MKIIAEKKERGLAMEFLEQTIQPADRLQAP
jgi:hypothetical protein